MANYDIVNEDLGTGEMFPPKLLLAYLTFICNFFCFFRIFRQSMSSKTQSLREINGLETDKLCKHERKVKVVAHKGGQYFKGTEA